MSFVRTVLGDIPPHDLGACDAHGHLIISPSVATMQNPDFLLDRVDIACAELRDFRAAGGRAVIDCMPCDCGRNVLKLAELSRRSAVHIVCATGLHLANYYDHGHWSHHLGADEMTGLFVSDIIDGIDERDYGGPLVRRTPHRAGVIKIATDSTITPREKHIFEAAANAHLQTGCPILTHTEQGTLALEQIAMLNEHGVDLRHVCLSHTDRKPDIDYHREILASGLRVEFDSAFRWKPGQGNPTLALVLELAPEFPSQIMLGMDAARRGYWRHYGGMPGLDFLLTTFTADLRAHGLSDELITRIFVTNPAETFAFVPNSIPS